MSVKLTRRAVLQVKIESVSGTAETLGVNDGLLVIDPDYKINPTVLERKIATPDLSPQAIVLGRRLASMTFKAELRSNSKTTWTLADAPIISRLFRACGYKISPNLSPSVLGVYDIDVHANEVDWAVSSGGSASQVFTTAGQPVAGDMITINSKVYTFQSVLTNVDGNVLIGIDEAHSFQNLVAAINGTGTPGTQYAAATTVNTDVSAVTNAGTIHMGADTVTVTALGVGAAGNSIQVGVSGASGTWGSGFLAGGADIASTTDVIGYAIEVTTGGASGTAQAQVVVTASPTQGGEIIAPAALTSGSPFTIEHGLTITPTFTGNLVVGQRWMVWLLPAGYRLTPISDNFESVTLGLNKDGVYHSMPGAFGTFQITAQAGQYAEVDFTFTGKFVDAVDQELVYPNYERTLPAQVEYARLRIDNFYAIVDKFTFDQGNDIQPRPDVSSAEGYIGTRIVARAPKGGIDPEADSIANQDFWGKLGAAKRMPYQMRVGKHAGNIIWCFAPATQYTGLTYRDRNGILTYDAALKFSRYNGNDEFALFLM